MGGVRMTQCELAAAPLRLPSKAIDASFNADLQRIDVAAGLSAGPFDAA